MTNTNTPTSVVTASATIPSVQGAFQVEDARGGFAIDDST